MGSGETDGVCTGVGADGAVDWLGAGGDGGGACCALTAGVPRGGAMNAAVTRMTALTKVQRPSRVRVTNPLLLIRRSNPGASTITVCVIW